MFFSFLAEDKVVWYPTLFETKYDIVRAVFFWLTIALIASFLTVFFLLRNKPSWPTVRKVFSLGSIGYFSAIAILALVIGFVNEEIVTILFVPILITIVLIAVCAVMLVLKRNKTTIIIASCLAGAGIIAVLVCMGVYFASGDAAERNWLTNDDVNSVALYVSAVLAIAVLIFVAIFFGRKYKNGFNTQSIAYAAICIATSFALSYLRIARLPQGGAITIASLLPLMVYSYMFGIKKGVLSGMIYGILQAFQDTYIIHPAQFILDYFAAFACIGLAGIFATVKKLDKLPQVQFVLGALIAGAGRFLMHFLSGVFAFSAFATGSPVVYSLSYQSAYVLPDLLICIVVGVVLFSSKTFVKIARRIQAQNIVAENKTESSEGTAVSDQ